MTYSSHSNTISRDLVNDVASVVVDIADTVAVFYFQVMLSVGMANEIPAEMCHDYTMGFKGYNKTIIHYRKKLYRIV